MEKKEKSEKSKWEKKNMNRTETPQKKKQQIAKARQLPPQDIHNVVFHVTVLCQLKGHKRLKHFINLEAWL